MADYLFVTDGVPPLVGNETSACALGLARALVALKHRVKILALGAPGQLSAVTGLAQRLRKVAATVGDEAFDLALYEGHFSSSDPTLYVLEAPSLSPAGTAALLGSAAEAMQGDGLLKPDCVVGWGEPSATALVRLVSNAKIFVLPSGDVGGPLPAGVAEALHLGVDGDQISARSLAAMGALAAHAVVLPSPSAQRDLERTGGLANRAADEPVVVVRFGCDEPPHDPASDAALPTRFSADAPAGKDQCRKHLVRRLGLAAGPKTLLLLIDGRSASGADVVLLDAIASWSQWDVAAVVLDHGANNGVHGPAAAASVPDSNGSFVDKARVAAIENPTRLAVLAAGDRSHQRACLAAADAELILNRHDLTGRQAGLAMRYGTLPIVPALGAAGDYLVDFDPGSKTGNALLFELDASQSLPAVIARAAVLRSDGTGWHALVAALLASVPRWSDAATAIDGLRILAEKETTLSVAS